MNTTKAVLPIMLSAICIFCGCATSFVSPNSPYDYGLLKAEQADANQLVPVLEKAYYTAGTTCFCSIGA
jgi:hypothetical protein